MKKKRLSLVRVCVGVAIGFTILVLLGWSYFKPKVDIGTGVSHDKRFPAGATDINYNISRTGSWGWENAEYQISESDFKVYAQKNGWKLQPITTPREIPLGLDPGGDLGLTVIEDGLIYESPIAENGGHIIAVYNRSSGRATVKDAKN